MTDTDMTCEDVVRLLDAYVAGDLDDATSVRLEQHAAMCSACEARLELVTRAAANNAADALRALGERAQLPVGMRERLLQSAKSVAAPGELSSAETVLIDAPRGPSATSMRRWGGGLATLAAAAALFVAVRKDAQRVDVTNPPTVSSDSNTQTAPVSGEAIRAAVVARIADDGARSEFAELDVATKELETELAKTPNDRDLRSYLSSVRARRDELERRVKDASL